MIICRYHYTSCIFLFRGKICTYLFRYKQCILLQNHRL